MIDLEVIGVPDEFPAMSQMRLDRVQLFALADLIEESGEEDDTSSLRGFARDPGHVDFWLCRDNKIKRVNLYFTGKDKDSFSEGFHSFECSLNLELSLLYDDDKQRDEKVSALFCPSQTERVVPLGHPCFFGKSLNKGGQKQLIRYDAFLPLYRSCGQGLVLLALSHGPWCPLADRAG